MRPLVFALLLSLNAPALAQEATLPAAEPAAPAEPTPTAEPAAPAEVPATDAPPPASEAPAPSESGWGEEEEYEKPTGTSRRRDRQEEAEDLPKGNDAAAGVVGGVASCLSVPVLGCVGVLCGPFSFVVVGGGMGAVGWMLGSLSGAKRIPLLPVLAAGVVGAGLTTLAAIPAYLMVGAGMALTSYAGSTVGTVVMSAGYLISTVVGLVGFIGTAVAVGVVAAQLGRGVVEGESALAFDLTEVPPPDEDEDEEEGDEEEEDDRPRKKKKKKAVDEDEEEEEERPRKRKLAADEEEEDEEDERPRKRRAAEEDEEEDD